MLKITLYFLLCYTLLLFSCSNKAKTDKLKANQPITLYTLYSYNDCSLVSKNEFEKQINYFLFNRNFSTKELTDENEIKYWNDINNNHYEIKSDFQNRLTNRFIINLNCIYLTEINGKLEYSLNCKISVINYGTYNQTFQKNISSRTYFNSDYESKNKMILAMLPDIKKTIDNFVSIYNKNY